MNLTARIQLVQNHWWFRAASVIPMAHAYTWYCNYTGAGMYLIGHRLIAGTNIFSINWRLFLQYRLEQLPEFAICPLETQPKEVGDHHFHPLLTPQNNFLVMDSCQDASCNRWCCGPRNVTQDLYLLTNYCQNWNDLLDHRRQNAKSTAERLVQIVELLLLTGTKATLKFDSHRLWWWWCWC